MIECPVCHDRVYNNLLRAEFPECPNGHGIGHWVSCANPKESHVYLEYQGSNCPYCEKPPVAGVPEGTKVKCLHVTAEGLSCVTRPFLWIKEGPPCFMNHIAKMKIFLG
jgi:hypothetical protein